MTEVRAVKRMCGSAVLLSLVLLIVPSLRAQGLSRDEKRIQERVNQSFNEACSFLERVVNINSGTMNTEGVRQVGAIFRTEFDKIGFQTRWLEMPKETVRAGHLFAERKGSRGKRPLLIGHLDTVFERDSPFRKFSRKGDKAYGPGVGDMKAGDVVMLFALTALHGLGLLDGSTVTVAMTGDEEKPGHPISTVRGELIAAAKRSDVALEFDGLVSANRTPHPGLWAIKYVYRYLHGSPSDPAAGRIKVKNWWHFNNAKDVAEGSWIVKAEGTTLASGSLPELDIAPGEEKEFTLALPMRPIGSLRIRFTLTATG